METHVANRHEWRPDFEAFAANIPWMCDSQTEVRDHGPSASQHVGGFVTAGGQRNRCNGDVHTFYLPFSAAGKLRKE